MRARLLIFVAILAMLPAVAARAQTSGLPPGGRIVDRIVAKIEGDIILLSQVRKLGEFQELIQGNQESDEQLLGELIEQWVVQTEADAAHFAQPAKSEVDREMNRVIAQSGSPTAFAQKLSALNLTADEVRALLTQQIYIERYLDYKFRPTVQIDPASIQTYYQKEFVPALAAKNQQAPPLSTVDSQIREILTQQAISQHTAQWLDETKSHLKIEMDAPTANTQANP